MYFASQICFSRRVELEVHSSNVPAENDNTQDLLDLEKFGLFLWRKAVNWNHKSADSDKQLYKPRGPRPGKPGKPRKNNARRGASLLMTSEQEQLVNAEASEEVQLAQSTNSPPSLEAALAQLRSLTRLPPSSKSDDDAHSSSNGEIRLSVYVSPLCVYVMSVMQE